MSNTEPGDIWVDDLLGRKEDAEFLGRFLTGAVKQKRNVGRQASFVLNIDGHWGAGKSFFVDRLAKQLVAGGCVVAQVNAWRDDHSDDPFVAVLSAIDAAVEPFTAKPGKPRELWQRVTSGALPVFKRISTGFVKTLIKKQIGEGLEDVLSDIPDTGNDALDKAIDESSDLVTVEVERIIDESAEAMIRRFTEQTKAVVGFRERLGAAATSLVEVTGSPVFVIVDELDRCRPSYAIALLERVKHLFEVDNVVFIFATNTDQLQHSVRGAYGPDFDGFRYLKRFFERTYLLEEPKPDRFLADRLRSVDMNKITAPRHEPVKFLERCVASWAMDLREIDQVIDLVSATTAVWQHDVPIDLALLIPLAVSFLRHRSSNWESVVTNMGQVSVQIGYTTKGGSFNGERVPVHLDLHGVIQTFSLRGKDMSDAMHMSTDNGGAYGYVREMLVPEWNGKQIRREQPSVLYELPRLVANAGRLSSQRDVP